VDPTSRSSCAGCGEPYYFHAISMPEIPTGQAAISVSGSTTNLTSTSISSRAYSPSITSPPLLTPSIQITPWHPPSAPGPSYSATGHRPRTSLPTPSTNDRRVAAYERHQRPASAIPPSASRGVAPSPFLSLPVVSLPPSAARHSRASTSARGSRTVNLRQTFHYLVVMHTEPVSYITFMLFQF
jgi:hypothetical protein